MKKWQRERWIKIKRLRQHVHKKRRKWYFRLFAKRVKVGYRLPCFGRLFEFFRRK